MLNNFISQLTNAATVSDQNFANNIVDDLVRNLFGNTDRVTEEEFQMMKECNMMLQNYISNFPGQRGCVSLSDWDKSKWISEYYEKLVKSGPQLLDDKFFDKSRFSNLGIGNDGAFTGYELFQFMYRINKAIAKHNIIKLLSSGITSTTIGRITSQSELLSCAEMLEKYVDRFPASGSVSFNNDDMRLWTKTFYPNLVENNHDLPDDKFFSSTDKTLGIGTDGLFTGYELFQFLFRLYKKIGESLIF